MNNIYQTNFPTATINYYMRDKQTQDISLTKDNDLQYKDSIESWENEGGKCRQVVQENIIENRS